MQTEKEWINPLKDWSTNPEEVANTVTHGFGFLLSLIGTTVMGTRVVRYGDSWRVAGCAIYLSSLVAVYGMSTLSHWCSTPELKHKFRSFDQGLIYLLIVATYTPFSLAFLRTSFWWSFLVIMWFIALSGFVSKVLFVHRVNSVSLWIYVILGWMPVCAGTALKEFIPPAGFWWMFVGGFCYTGGIIFLRFDHCFPHFHALWHLFVIAGSGCHFFGILLFVAR